MPEPSLGRCCCGRHFLCSVTYPDPVFPAIFLFRCPRERVAFGKALSEDSVVRYQVAECRMEIAQVRKKGEWNSMELKSTMFFFRLANQYGSHSREWPSGPYH